ncbi:MAG: asparagine synthase (glutamine-hydrolyzing) [Pseudomonadota bacterium]
MCGIGGFSGNFSSSLLIDMHQAIEHRGPDDEGVLWLQEESVGLCHRRLSIIDLSALGHQPMWDVSGRVAIVFNGEIYNYRELRADLEQRGMAFASSTDTEVLLNLYLAEGESMLTKLNGMFAFALWDNEKKRLFLARDGFGVKPFYYAQTELGFIFASEMKSLLKEKSISRAIDAQAVLNYLTYLWCPAPRTMLSAVKKLLPGHALIVEKGKITKQWQYYDLPYNQEKTSLSPEKAAEALCEHLAESVRRQMVADVPVGAFLSGGLDSSAIAFFAKKHAHEGQLDCFTIGFKDDAWINEGMAEDLPYAQRVAKHLGVNLHTIEVGPEMAQEFSKMIFQLDEPQADPSAINVLLISKLAREKGIKVLLSGSGGDDIFSGYRRHQALYLEKYWNWLPKSALSIVQQFTHGFSTSRASTRRVSKLFAYADVEGPERLVSYFNWIDPLSRNFLLSSWMRSELVNGLGENPLLERVQSLPRSMCELDKMLYLESKYFLADHNLNYTDKMAMAAGVEVRVPFLDNDLVAFAAQLPSEYKQRRLEGKWLFKKAMEPFLPKDIIYRPKTGFGVPIRSWLKKELRELVDELLSDEVIRRRGLFDVAGVRSFLEKDRLGHIDGSYIILAIMSIELWCQAFLDVS